MENDMFGVSRLKVNLHMHTTLSDGSKTPEEAAEIYKKAGYDVVAITDHWLHRESGEINGLRTLSGAEYNMAAKMPAQAYITFLALDAAANQI